jgi:hypothetical protein
MLCLKWFVTSCIITIFVRLSPFSFRALVLTYVEISSPSPAEITDRNGGNYDGVPYQYYGYPKVAKNMLEMDKTHNLASRQASPIAERVLRPRYLCFLREEGTPAMIMKVDDW